jgi:hypothetical protein
MREDVKQEALGTLTQRHAQRSYAHYHCGEKRIRLGKTAMGCIPCVCSTPCSRADAAKLKTYAWDESDIRRIEGLQEHIDDGYWSFKD